ncbi:MAG TPA: RidA family protein [Pseudonocardiaceae bacterium]|jgi:enamine deaminase RidA (YjgF/YER057c/UK114 family)|nr:RidA family protein [Pseudonocardiaceae bacterium]
MTVEHTDPPELATPVLGIYSHIAVGRGSAVVAIAGQIALDVDGNLVGPGDHGAQAEQAFRNLSLALASAGCGPADLLKYTVHVVGHQPELVDPIFAAGRRVFGADWPRTASTLLGVQALGAPEWLIEIDALAVIPSSSD